MTTKTQVIWLANEVLQLQDEIMKNYEESPGWVIDKINFIAGYAAALKAGESDE